MNVNAQKPKQSVSAGSCTGIINGTEQFRAGLVEFSEFTYPLPHGHAYVMFARHRSADFSTKEITISLSSSAGSGDYSLTPDLTAVRISFVDNTSPTDPVIYMQLSGEAKFQFDNETSTFSGDLKNIILVNNDLPTPRELLIDLAFCATNALAKYGTLNRKAAA